ncbi:LANO_0B06106g1_1 [Lachancea nothofagi CBS 11611]|uniref:LANO_0B06106g1_1 n=1 Tax=Lachancea nothofagi CBS 11611 TaxID=1266666 RepID=A0A1G4IZG0_9SACH|nr:LANO_0B06106g1_1 [Lachancea nothofagi CBS 11611]
MLRFIVSINNTSDGPCDFRIMDYENGVLKTKQMYLRQSRDSIEEITALCYLKPGQNWDFDTSIQSTDQNDTSDYLLVGRGDGFIEVFTDVQAKSTKNSVLEPSWVLTCGVAPENFETDGQSPVLTIEYSCGLLYCVAESGLVSVFILNLPRNYIKTECVINAKDLDDKHCPKPFSTPNSEGQPVEDAKFLKEIEFSGRTQHKHIFNFLAPAHGKYRDYQAEIYADVPCFQPSFSFELGSGITYFRINPINVLSFIATGPSIGLKIHKIIITNAYLIYLNYLKCSIENASGSAQADYWKMCGLTDCGNEETDPSIEWDLLRTIFKAQLSNCSIFEQEEVFNSNLRARGGVPELKYYTCWKQKSSSHYRDNNDVVKCPGDDISGASSGCKILRNALVQPGRKICRNQRSWRTFLKNDDAAAPRNRKSRFSCDSCIDQKRLDANFFPTAFEFANSNPEDGTYGDATEESAISREEKASSNSFLTVAYHNFEILAVNKCLTFTAHRPKFGANPYLEIIRFRDAESLATTEPQIENMGVSHNISQNSFPFQRVFVIDESLCLFLNADGLVLVDRIRLRNLDIDTQNSFEFIKVIDFYLGLVKDATILIKECRACQGCGKCQGDVSLSVEIVATCETGHILLLGAEFYMHSRLGRLQVLDCLFLTLPKRKLGKLCLMGQLDAPTRKRHTESKEDTALIKRARRADHRRNSNS